jgi:hypothetical protein
MKRARKMSKRETYARFDELIKSLGFADIDGARVMRAVEKRGHKQLRHFSVSLATVAFMAMGMDLDEAIDAAVAELDCRLAHLTARRSR